jgi:hypothetical protein
MELFQPKNNTIDINKVPIKKPFKLERKNMTFREVLETYNDATLEKLENLLETIILRIEDFDKPENQIGLWAVSLEDHKNFALTIKIAINLMKTLKLDKLSF